MDHKEFLANLPAKQRQRLQIRSNGAGLLHLLGHWGLIGLVGSLIYMRVPGWPVLLPVQGVLIIFTFTLLHECTHKTPFKSPWLNEVVGRISGFLVGLPFVWFRYFHMAHHKFTNDPARDPELVGQKKPQNWLEYFWHITGFPTWAAQLTGLVRLAAGNDDSEFIPKSKQHTVQVESIIIVILYTLIGLYSFSISTLPLMLWIIPIILGQPFLRLYLVAEHGRCPPVNDMLRNSRTVLTNPVVRFLAWNMPYHVEHHTAPNVPFHQLPTLHTALKQHIQFLEPGYRHFHKTYTKQFEGMREVDK